MKIGILTFHCANNYGAVLQAYGLQEYLKKLGYDTYIVDYRPKYITSQYKTFAKELPQGNLPMKVKHLLRNILIIPIRKRRCKVFNLFRRNRLKIFKLNLNNSENDFDSFIFGSDQIWNQSLTGGNLDKIFLGDFPAANGKKLIAYAASTGSLKNISNKSEIIDQLLKFKAIGVREQSLDIFIGNNIPNSIHSLTLDPVLLAGKQIFEKLIKPIYPDTKKKYLLLFQLGYDIHVEKIASQIANEKGLNLVKISSYFESLTDSNIISDASPEQFLAYVKNASYVVTTSFHGTAFSILFEKDFNTIGLSETVSERMINLLLQLGLEDRFYNNSNKINTTEINYRSVNKKLEQLRIASRSFINTAFA